MSLQGAAHAARVERFAGPLPAPAAAAVASGVSGRVLGEDTPLVLFDSVCGLCNNFVKFVTSVNADKFRFEPLQSPLGLAQLKRFGLPDDLSTIVLVYRGRHWIRSSAALNVMWLLGPPWALLYAFIVLPVPMRDAAYKYVAANRYAWFGKVKGGDDEVAPAAAAAADATVRSVLDTSKNRVVMFAKTTCPFCKRATALLRDRVDEAESPLVVVNLDERADGPALQQALRRITGVLTVPQIFNGDGAFLGGGDDVRDADAAGKLVPLLARGGVRIAAPRARL
mmetsp:Transcript_12529/g.43842  ORF Transcript_12529/g.43842 Transcript_12529/m.43842 type:complete len:282 (-) Transcript_12529:142-987(-)